MKRKSNGTQKICHTATRDSQSFLTVTVCTIVRVTSSEIQFLNSIIPSKDFFCTKSKGMPKNNKCLKGFVINTLPFT